MAFIGYPKERTTIKIEKILSDYIYKMCNFLFLFLTKSGEVCIPLRLWKFAESTQTLLWTGQIEDLDSPRTLLNNMTVTQPKTDRAPPTPEATHHCLQRLASHVPL